MTTVGLPDSAVRESRERTRTSIRSGVRASGWRRRRGADLGVERHRELLLEIAREMVGGRPP